MKIKELHYVVGDKFGATLECEGCGNTVYDMHGCDLTHFYNKGALDLQCPRCGKTRRELEGT